MAARWHGELLSSEGRGDQISEQTMVTRQGVHWLP